MLSQNLLFCNIHKMSRIKIAKQFIGIIFLTSLPVWAFATTEKLLIIEPAIIQRQTDTLLPAKKNIESTKENKADAVIKKVPIARKQAIPIPIKIKVDPGKIIKPNIKVIKPVIKILH